VGQHAIAHDGQPDRARRGVFGGIDPRPQLFAIARRSWDTIPEFFAFRNETRPTPPRVEPGVRAQGSGSLPSERRLVAATLARCYVCGVDGPVHRLTEHLREDHALSGRALGAALGAALAKSTMHATVTA
jgi:hypothetical protein